jgi:hypothetical protein
MLEYNLYWEPEHLGYWEPEHLGTTHEFTQLSTESTGS